MTLRQQNAEFGGKGMLVGDSDKQFLWYIQLKKAWSDAFIERRKVIDPSFCWMVLTGCLGPTTVVEGHPTRAIRLLKNCHSHGSLAVTQIDKLPSLSMPVMF